MNQDDTSTHDYDTLHRYWDAGHQSASPVFAARSRLVRELIPDSGAGRTALDAGCGTGVNTRELLARGYRVDAFDGSRYAVEALRAELTGSPQADFRAQICDLFAYQPERGPYDLVIFSEVLEHIPDDTAALRRLSGMLADDGMLLLTVPIGPELYGAEDSFSGHERRYRLEELRERLDAADLEPTRVRTYGFPLLYLYLYAKKLFLRESDLQRTSERVSSSRRTTQLLRAVMRGLMGIDSLFTWTNSGVGVVLLARKRQ